MPRNRILAVYFSILAVWMQLLAPVAMATARPDVDPFSIICSHRPIDAKGPTQLPHAPADHGCCALCHVQLAASAVDVQPSFTIFDYPILSPRRWRLVEMPSRTASTRAQHRPRGPPSLV